MCLICIICNIWPIAFQLEEVQESNFLLDQLKDNIVKIILAFLGFNAIDLVTKTRKTRKESPTT